MKHSMTLQYKHFSAIVSGRKKIESRLFDEKRKLVKVGDVIEFSLSDEHSRKISVKVTNLLPYSTFSDLVDNHHEELGYARSDLDKALLSLREIYTSEQEKKYGVLGLRFSLLEGLTPINLPEAHYRVAVKGYYISDSKLLLIKNRGGRRDLPGGGIDHGEDVFTALRREVLEEMSLHIESIAKRPLYFGTGKSLGGRQLSKVVYSITLSDFSTFSPSDECVEYAFFSPQDAIHDENVYEWIQDFLKSL